MVCLVQTVCQKTRPTVWRSSLQYAWIAALKSVVLYFPHPEVRAVFHLSKENFTAAITLYNLIVNIFVFHAYLAYISRRIEAYE